MAETIYYVRADGDIVRVGIPVTNPLDTNSGEVSVVFNAFSGFTLDSTEMNMGDYTTLTRTWDNFYLGPKETQILYLNLDITNADAGPFTLTGTITNAVDGNDGEGTSISVTIYKEEDSDLGQTYKAKLAQTTTDNPTATIFVNELSAAPALARSAEGVYTVTLNGAFTVGKVHAFAQLEDGASPRIVEVAHTSANVITISTFAIDGSTADDIDGNLWLTIEVFPA